MSDESGYPSKIDHMRELHSTTLNNVGFYVRNVENVSGRARLLGNIFSIGSSNRTNVSHFLEKEIILRTPFYTASIDSLKRKEILLPHIGLTSLSPHEACGNLAPTMVYKPSLKVTGVGTSTKGETQIAGQLFYIPPVSNTDVVIKGLEGRSVKFNSFIPLDHASRLLRQIPVNQGDELKFRQPETLYLDKLMVYVDTEDRSLVGLDPRPKHFVPGTKEYLQTLVDAYRSAGNSTMPPSSTKKKKPEDVESAPPPPPLLDAKPVRIYDEIPFPADEPKHRM